MMFIFVHRIPLNYNLSFIINFRDQNIMIYLLIYDLRMDILIRNQIMILKSFENLLEFFFYN